MLSSAPACRKTRKRNVRAPTVKRGLWRDVRSRDAGTSGACDVIVTVEYKGGDEVGERLRVVDVHRHDEPEEAEDVRRNEERLALCAHEGEATDEEQVYSNKTNGAPPDEIGLIL